MSEANFMDQTSTAELLGRIDERTTNMSQAMSALDVKMDIYGDRLSRMESSFGPVKSVVYGTIGLILIAVASALIAFVVYKPQITQPSASQHIEVK